LVGAPGDDAGGSAAGTTYVLFMNTDGTVSAVQEIGEGVGGGPAALDASDFFGYSVAGIGDLNDDGFGDVAVGAYGDDDGGSARGAVYVLMLT